MWPYLIKLGVFAALGVGLGLAILFTQESITQSEAGTNHRNDQERNRTTRQSGQNSQARRRHPQKRDKNTQRQDLEKELLSGNVQCPICSDTVNRQSKVWSCKICWKIFHLDCIRKWVNRAAKSDCPCCRSVIDRNSLRYKCMCGRVSEPGPMLGVMPHCCGSWCQRACGDLCHPGECRSSF